MKKLISVSLLAAAGILAAGAAQADEALAKAKNCMTCHKIDGVQVGPGYKDVAAKYKGQANAEASLAETIMKGTGPSGKGWQKEKKATMAFMPPNGAVKPDEAKKLAAWILSLK